MDKLKTIILCGDQELFDYYLTNFNDLFKDFIYFDRPEDFKRYAKNEFIRLSGQDNLLLLDSRSFDEINSALHSQFDVALYHSDLHLVKKSYFKNVFLHLWQSMPVKVARASLLTESLSFFSREKDLHLEAHSSLKLNYSGYSLSNSLSLPSYENFTSPQNFACMDSLSESLGYLYLADYLFAENSTHHYYKKLVFRESLNFKKDFDGENTFLCFVDLSILSEKINLSDLSTSKNIHWLFDLDQVKKAQAQNFLSSEDYFSVINSMFHVPSFQKTEEHLRSFLNYLSLLLFAQTLSESEVCELMNFVNELDFTPRESHLLSFLTLYKNSGLNELRLNYTKKGKIVFSLDEYCPLEVLEAMYIERVYKHCHTNVEKSAQILKMSPRTLARKLKALSLRDEDKAA